MSAYEFSPSLTLRQIKDEGDYINMNDVDADAEERFERDDKFGQDVIRDKSGVQVPIEIYEGCESAFIARSCIFFFLLLPVTHVFSSLSR